MLKNIKIYNQFFSSQELHKIKDLSDFSIELLEFLGEFFLFFISIESLVKSTRFINNGFDNRDFNSDFAFGALFSFCKD